VVFENPQILILLILLPAVFLFALVGHYREQRRMRTFANRATWKEILPYKSTFRNRAHFLLMFIGLAFVIFATAGPKFGAAFEQVQSMGLDVVVAVDTSDSMLARDMKPSRLIFAKEEVMKILDRAKGDRVALMPFSGQAYLLCPLTLDYSALRMFLGILDTDIIPTEGTDVAGAIDASISAFDKTERKYRVMILLTDGEDLKGKGIEAAKRAQKDGIVIFVLGIGTENAVPIPLSDNKGNVVYKKDKKGDLVMTKIDEKMLSKISSVTGGFYARATYDDSAQEAIFSRIDKMERQELEGKLVSRLQPRYQWFLVIGIVLVSLGLSVHRRKKPNGR